MALKFLDEHAFRDLYSLSHSFSEFEGFKIMHEIIYLKGRSPSPYMLGFLKKVKTLPFGSALHSWVTGLCETQNPSTNSVTPPRLTVKSPHVKTSKTAPKKDVKRKNVGDIISYPVVSFSNTDIHTKLKTVADSLSGNTNVCKTVHQDSTCTVCGYFLRKGGQTGALPWKYFKLLKLLHRGNRTVASSISKIEKFQQSELHVDHMENSSHTESSGTDISAGAEKPSESRTQRKRRIVQNDISNALDLSLLQQNVGSMKRCLISACFASDYIKLSVALRRELEDVYFRRHGKKYFSTPDSEAFMIDVIRSKIVEGETFRRLSKKKKK